MNDIALFFEQTGSMVAVKKKSKKQKTQQQDPEKFLCHLCKIEITGNSEKIAIQNDHYHTCINPAGIEYHIGCFREAIGCSQIGPLVSEHTWFTGYRWQLALCAHCKEHLGWLFRGDDNFYGLIYNRLITSNPD